MVLPAAHEFGDFRLDPARRSLERTNGRRVALTGKAFDALVCLLVHAGQPVSRKTLMRELWPDRVVEENNLTQAIAVLRRTLGDDYIVTLPGRGYQLVAVSRRDHRPAGSHWLVFRDERLPLVEGENLIGRDPQADVWLDFAAISRRHARIVVGVEGTLLEDLGSKNGTSVDGRRLGGPARLHDGQRIGLGTLGLVYRTSGVHTATVTQAGGISHLARGDGEDALG